MKQPPYERDGLKKAMVQCDKNIEAFKQGIENEEKYKAELRGYLRMHDEYDAYITAKQN